MRRPARLLCLALALALLAGCGVTAPEAPEPEAPPPTELWLRSDAPMAEALADLAAEYAAAFPDAPVNVRLFPGETELAAALNDARPDLLLCPGERGIALWTQGKLREAAPAAALNESFLALDACMGRGFFPLGAETPVLAVNAAGFLASPVTDGVGEGALEHVESLCSLAAAHGLSTGQPFFAVDSWAGFFALCLRQAGEDFGGERAALAAGENGERLYNLVAEAAYDGGLYVGRESAAELVRRGYVTCALLPSRELARGAEGLACFPAPALTGGAPVLPARVWGLAVTAPEERMLPGVNAFLSWLLEGERLAPLALDEGLLPAVGGGESRREEGSLANALLAAAERAQLVLDDGQEPWRERAEDFDAELRAAFELLQK